MVRHGARRILDTFAGQPTDGLALMPITMMFAADQVGEPYGKYATDYRTLVRGQLATAERFNFDYVSVISDPGVEAHDCGATVQFYDDQPPAIDESNARLADKTELHRLAAPDPLAGGRMTNRVRGVEALHEQVGGQLFVEGWIEGPCAEGADLRGLNTLLTDFFDDPDFVRDLFDFVVAMELDFAQAQIDAGADIIGIGDAAASLVGPAIYEQFVFPYEKKLVAGVQQLGGRVRLHICGNTRPLYRWLGELGCEMIDLDSMNPMDEARAVMGDEQVLLGNIDPVRVLRDGTPDSITDAIAACHRAAGDRYIVGAGCEIPRDTKPDNVRALTRYARGAS